MEGGTVTDVLTCADGSVCDWPEYCVPGSRCALAEKDLVQGARIRARREGQRQDAALVAAWRAKHPDSFCSDRAALLLARLEAEFAPKGGVA